MTPTTLAVLLLTLVTGAVLMWLGWRGRRIDRAPICRGCGFDLTGVLPDGKTCPECGSGLVRAAAVRIGHRRRVWSAALVGVGLTAAPLSMFGMAGYAALTGDSLARFMPVGVLLAQARHGNAEAITGAGKELIVRLNAGKLSNSQQQRITDAILEIQGDPATPWDESLGDFVEVARIGGGLDDDEYQRFLNQAMVFEFATRPIVAIGDPVPVSVSMSQQRVGSGSTVQAHVSIRELRVGDITIQRQSSIGPGGSGAIPQAIRASGFTFAAWGSASGVSGGGVTQYFSRLPDTALPPGPQTLVVEYTVEGKLAVGGISPAFGAVPDKARLTSSRLRLNIAPEGERDLEFIAPNDEMELRLRREVGVKTLIFENSRPGLDRVTIAFDFSHLPVPLAHDVFIQLGDTQLHIGTVQQTAADENPPTASRRWGIGRGLSPSHFPPETTSVTLILKPNIDLAIDRPDLRALYNGEVVFGSVPIERR